LPSGYVIDNTDCDDNNANAYPGNIETCLDGVDGDCDGADSTGTCDGDLTDADFTVTGISSNDRLGQGLSYAGDITGSSTSDFALSSRWRSNENGAVYVFAGSDVLSGSSSASSANVIISGQNGERFGHDIGGGTSMLGGITADFNNDGNDDLIVGAPYGDGDGGNRGRAYIFFGPLSGSLTSASADITIFGESVSNNDYGVHAGNSVAFAGDVNNDGFADILIGDPDKAHNYGANGEAYLLFGSNSLPSSLNLQDLGASRPYGLEIHSHFEDNDGWEGMGSALDAVGDVNGDGIDDIMVSAWRWDQSTPVPLANPGVSGNFGSETQQENYGAVFVWYGSAGLASSANNLTVSHITPGNHTADITFIGENAGDQIGRSAAGAGDFNGDGNMDIIIGSEHFNSSQGAAYVVAGDIAGEHSLSPSNAAVFLKMTGEGAGDAAGRWVGSAGNLDADANGTSDVLVGAKLADSNGSNSGATYVVFGGPSVTGTMSLSAADAIIAGTGAGNETGINVTGLDDMDADGVPEILIGSYRQGSAAGAVQFIYGTTFQ